jgi:hypothetical protein
VIDLVGNNNYAEVTHEIDPSSITSEDTSSLVASSQRNPKSVSFSHLNGKLSTKSHKVIRHSRNFQISASHSEKVR